ncbi:MAG: hypothetical protein GIX02_03215 [Candidatus Eremiobacteraeota bacterium]|nr:hypothetical protein [Candidatus Eremiobacteraeota bacterium]
MAGVAPGPTLLFFTAGSGETGAISRQMDPNAGTGTNANQSVVYSGNVSANFGWISAAGTPGVLAWPAETYTVRLDVRKAGPGLIVTEVDIYRVDANGGPGTNGLGGGPIGSDTLLTQSLGTPGVITFPVIAGTAQVSAATDRVGVKIRVHNTNATNQSFSYNAGAGAASGVTITPGF